MNLLEAVRRMRQGQDLAIFYHRWAAAEGTGMPLRETLRSLRGNAETPSEARAHCLSAALERGDPLLRDAAHAFTPMEVAFLDVGMTSGMFAGSLEALATIYEADRRAVRRAESKMAYPLLLTLLACWIPTAPLAAFVGIWAWLAVGLLASGVVFAFGGALLLAYFNWLRGKKKWVQARFFWALATALETGLSLQETLALAVRVATPSDLAEYLRYVVPDGRPLVEILRSTGAFDPSTLAMIETGEVAGKLPETLRTAARYIESGMI